VTTGAAVQPETVAAVLERLRVDRPPRDLAGLRSLYAAWYGASPLDRAGRTRFLIEELGISEEIASRVPDDRPTPPRP
jgi:hypothetical protein